MHLQSTFYIDVQITKYVEETVMVSTDQGSHCTRSVDYIIDSLLHLMTKWNSLSELLTDHFESSTGDRLAILRRRLAALLTV